MCDTLMEDLLFADELNNRIDFFSIHPFPEIVVHSFNFHLIGSVQN